MSFLSNLFGKGRRTTTQLADEDLNMDHESTTLEGLSAQATDPNDEEVSANQAPEPVKTKLGMLLNADYNRRGWIDGRYKHSQSIRAEAENAIIADLSIAIQERVEEIQESLGEAELILAGLDQERDAEHVAMISASIKERQRGILNLKDEQDQVNQGKGLALKPLSAYRRAYQDGLKASFDDRGLFKKYGMFNEDDNNQGYE